MARIEHLLFALALALVAGLSVFSHKLGTVDARSEFERVADHNVEAIVRRMATYVHSLNAAAAYVRRSTDVTAAEFEMYVDDLDIANTLPGINGIGLIVPVDSAQRSTLVRDMRAEGYPAFDIHPQTGNDESFVIKYIFPFEPNREAMGLDITFEEGRREAARQSLASGEARITPRIDLVQEDESKAGFLLLVPVNGAQANAGPTPAPLEGWIYAPFVADNLLTGLAPLEGRYFDFAVFDGPSDADDTLIFRSAEPYASEPAYQVTRTINEFGRSWTVRYSSNAVFERTFRSQVPYIIALVGSLSLMLLFAWFQNQRHRTDAIAAVSRLRQRRIVEQESANRAMVENAVTPVFVLDGDNRILFANQAAQMCFGYSETEMKEMSFSKLAGVENAGSQIAGPSFPQGRTRKGETLVLDLQRNNWTTADGEARVTAIVRDITAQTNLQTEIERTKTLYDLALQGSHIGVFDIDLSTGHSDVSDTWCRIMGFEKGCDNLDTQKEFLARIHPDDLPVLQKADADCISGKTTRSIAEYRMYFGRDTWRWMRSDAVVSARDESGKALRLIGTQTDVTEVRHARNALEASEEQFRQVLAAAPIGMALINDRAQFLGVNTAFCGLCGASEDELLTEYRLSDILHPDDLKVIYRTVAAKLEADSPETYIGEHRLQGPDGDERWGLFHISWSFDKNANKNFFIAQIVDITEQKRLEQIKDEFVSTVSHELRTPLTSIKGALGLIRATDDPHRSSATNRLLEIAASNADRLTHIVNDILDLEKISSGEVAFEIDTLDIGDLIEGTAHELSPFAREHNNTLRVEAPDAPLMVVADAARTRQVIANLISNACKYSFDDTEVRVIAEPLDDTAIIYVINRGAGVPDAFRPRIFNAFSQADGSDTRAKGGTGLGLNISRQIVARQGGTIGFESVKGGVTVFWFTCPLAGSQHAVLPPTLAASPMTGANRATVLHLEDDADFADVIRSGLSDSADVIRAGTISEAHLLLDRFDFDAVILDWQLPDGDASVLLDDIKRLHPNASILGLSAQADRDPEPRIVANLVKSRADVPAVVKSVLGAMSKAS